MKAYWDAGDPDHIDGPGAESFTAFLGRVRQAVTGLAELSNQGAAQVALFGHGQFIQAMRWVMREPPIRVSRDSMRAFRQIDRENPIGNQVGIAVRYDGQKWAVT